jgi:hypothetical protein
MHPRFLLALAAAATAACTQVVYTVAPEAPPAEDCAEGMPRAVADDYEHTVNLVATMVHDPWTEDAVARRGLSVVNLTWEDTGRAMGSALGPNISDLTLQVRMGGRGGFRDTLMPVVRYPNFSDHTADVPADRFFVRVGNQRAGGALGTVPLTELLSDLRRFASAPDTLPGAEARTPPDGGAPKLDLRAARDTHFLVSAQAVFLPIPKQGKAEFNPVLFNYQSAPDSPAVLAILATREGTSMAVIENRQENATFRGWGQELYFNEGGRRAAFMAERRSDVQARIAAQGGPRTEADRSALGRGADVMALIQIPLVHEHRGVLPGLAPEASGYAYEFSDDPLAGGGFGPNDATIRARAASGSSDLERAVLGHGPRLGPFAEGSGARLVRDPNFPIRITVQFYKATSNGVVTEADLDAVARNIASAYAHADYVGSLVLPEGDRARPTAWQTMPGDWFPW